MNSIPIDIVLPWVNDKDPEWQKQYKIWKDRFDTDSINKSNVRFQSWDNLQYWFRAVEKCLPWFRQIVFITCGHVPAFLKLDHPRLKIVKHDDYIPKEYLPTFNINTIEMNIHRIDALSENFVYFNDDMFPLLPTEQDYYFQNDVVCDEAVENIITTSSFGAVSRTDRYKTVNNMFIINKYFKKREVQAAHPEQWFNENYGDRLERTKACEYWYDFTGFYDNHMPGAMKKSTLAHLWEVEKDTLDRSSRDRFRGHADVSQYLIRYWQLCSGNFIPRRTEGKVFFPNIETYKDVVKAIKGGDYPMICFNENCTPEQFEIIKRDINEALEERFPEKSSFEK